MLYASDTLIDYCSAIYCWTPLCFRLTKIVPSESFRNVPNDLTILKAFHLVVVVVVKTHIWIFLFCSLLNHDSLLNSSFLMPLFAIRILHKLCFVLLPRYTALSGREWSIFILIMWLSKLDVCYWLAMLYVYLNIDFSSFKLSSTILLCYLWYVCTKYKDIYNIYIYIYLFVYDKADSL